MPLATSEQVNLANDVVQLVQFQRQAEFDTGAQLGWD